MRVYSERYSVSVEDPFIFFLISGILAILAIIVLIIGFIIYNRNKNYSKKCTSKTKGKVVGWSNVSSNDIRLKKFEYVVDGKKYYVNGPKFVGSTIIRATIGAGTSFKKGDLKVGVGTKNYSLLNSSTNLTVDGELPLYVKMVGDRGVAYQVIDERYPEGKEVDIYYCPDAPKKAFVERFAKMPAIISIGIPGIIAGVFIAVAVVLLLLGMKFS